MRPNVTRIKESLARQRLVSVWSGPLDPLAPWEPSDGHGWRRSSSPRVGGARRWRSAQTGTGIGAINGPNPLPLHTMSSSGVFQLRDPDYPGLRCVALHPRDAHRGRQPVGQRRRHQRRDGLRGRAVLRAPGAGHVQELAGPVPASAGRTPAFRSTSASPAWTWRRRERDRAGAQPRLRGPLGDVHGCRRSASAADLLRRAAIVPRAGAPTSPTSDIFAAMTEAYANQPASFDPPDYSVGEEIARARWPFRSMHDPSLPATRTAGPRALPRR